MSAGSVRWELARCWVGTKVAEDEEKMLRLLAQGFEPFAVSQSGSAGYVYHLRRPIETDGTGGDRSGPR